RQPPPNKSALSNQQADPDRDPIVRLKDKFMTLNNFPLRIANPRHGSARQSRNQRSAAVSAGPAAAGRNGTKAWSEIGTSGGSDALRLVLRTQPRSVKSSRLATTSTDADRVQLCAAKGALNTGCVQETGKQERGQPCPPELHLKPGTR